MFLNNYYFTSYFSMEICSILPVICSNGTTAKLKLKGVETLIFNSKWSGFLKFSPVLFHWDRSFKEEKLL